MARGQNTLDSVLDQLCTRQRPADCSARVQQQSRRLLTACAYLLTAMVAWNATLLVTVCRAARDIGGG